LKITIEQKGKETEVIETEQFFVLTDKGSSCSGSYEFLIGKLYYRLKEIEKEYADSTRNKDTV
jgi:hypothetical protein